ncbi:MAG: 6-bladed beta-propeller [Candidatus Aegiribacteria sp.]|nr:6-bladed beta-propeller [Candidatus Aegiribacteria sp.]
MRKMYTICILLASILFLSLSCGEETNEITQENREESSIELVIADTIGIEIGDSNYVFGTIIDAAFMPDGRIVLLDPIKNRISTFSSDGEFLFSTGNTGIGPGEFNEPSSIAILSNGDIAVADHMQYKIVFFDSLFCFKREICGFIPQPPPRLLTGKDSSVVGLQVHYYREDDAVYVGARLGSWSDSPEPDIVYYSEYNRFDGDGPVYIPNVVHCTDLDGNMFYSPFSHDDYQIMRLSPDGDTLFNISEPYTRMNKTQEEIASEHMSYICDTPGFNNSDTRAISARWEPDPVRYAITGLYVDRMQRLWVATGRGEGPSPVFEVYDVSGNHLFSVSTTLPAEARKWRIVFGDNRILAFDTNPDDYSKVIIINIEN